MTDWSFLTRTRDSTRPLADLAPYLTDREMTWRLNRPPTASGSMNMASPRASSSILQPGVHELELRRDSDPVDTLLRLTKASPAVGRVGNTIKFEWEGIETYLHGLLIPAATVVTSVAQSQAAWERIAAGIALDGASVFAFTRGDIPATDPVRSRTYTEPMDVLSAVQELAALEDGFDFDFDRDRNFNCYYPYRGSDTGIVFEYGRNLLELSYDIDAGPGAVATDVLVKGNAASATATDAAARTAYGRVDALQAAPDNAAAAGTLQAYADASMLVLAQPAFVPSITIDADHAENPWGSYWLGDLVTVRCKVGDGSYVNIDKKYRITAITVKVNDLGTESISLELNDVMPMVLDRAIIAMKRDMAANASNPITMPNMADRIAALERALV